MRYIFIADLTNPATGKTWREENAARTHAIPLGALVEIFRTGVRLFVARQTRDCDETPLYSLSAYPPSDGNQEYSVAMYHGYAEQDIGLVLREAHPATEWRYCFNCQASHTHKRGARGWKCGNCGFTEPADTEEGQ